MANLAKKSTGPTGPQDEVMKVTLDRGVCVTAYHPPTQTGWAISLSAQELNSNNLATKLCKLEDQVGALLQRCEIKIVGNDILTTSLQSFLKSNNIPIKAVAKENAERFNILFYPKTGRLRVATEIAPVTPKIDSTVTSSKPAIALVPNAVPKKTKVLIVDDSITIQRLLNAIFVADPEIEVVATAGRPSQVEELILRHRPDVITMDIHMPEMDGVTLLKKLMPQYPIPTVMITSLSIEEGSKVLDALEHGAVDYIQKPSADVLKVLAPQIVERIKVAAKAKIFKSKIALRSTAPKLSKVFDDSVIVAIGSSTGGTEAVKEVFVRLPEHIPPILVVQHIPPVFSRAFAERLNQLCPFEVKEAEDGDIVRPDLALIAPGGKNMRLERRQGKLRVVVEETPPRNRHRPSVDILFDSVAETMNKKAIGIILTGMGADGAQGLLKMKNAGARTVAQDEASSVVYGMPREAVKLGAAEPMDLFKIPEHLMNLLNNPKQS